MGLLSEHLVYEAGSRNPWKWKPIPGHERNEPLDCRNYALAAFKALPCNLDKIDRKLKQVRRGDVENQEHAAAEPKQTPAKNQNAMNKYYDTW